MLRNFYCGKELKFDDHAMLVSGGQTGPWTLCRDIRINDVQLTKQTLRLAGRRIYLVYDTEEKRFRDVAEAHYQTFESSSQKPQVKGEEVTLEMSLPANLTDGTIQHAIGRLFYSSQEEFLKALPFVWRSCAFNQKLAVLSDQAKPQGTTATDPSKHQDQPDDAKKFPPTVIAKPEGAELRVAPQPAYTPDPPYSDAARAALLEGTVIINVVIAPDGTVHNARLLHCLGLGLDEKAVEELLEWKFKPATKDGKPVWVELNVEIGFHLF